MYAIRSYYAAGEMLLRRLGEALARTSRQVNMLEQRLAPTLSDQVARMRRTLDEREREEHRRLKWLRPQVVQSLLRKE